MGETLVTVVGNVCSAVTPRTIGPGANTATFWIRSQERRYDKNRRRWVNGRHLGVRVTCGRRLATNAQLSLREGDPVIVHGRLHTSEHAADGRTYPVTEMDALALGPNLRWCTTRVEGLRQPCPEPAPARTAA